MAHFIYVRQALQDLRINPMRTFLSILGLVIGVVSVTVMFGVGEGLKDQVLGQFSDISTNTITVVAWSSFNPFVSTRSQELLWFTETDIVFFKESMWFIKDITPVAELDDPVYVKGEKIEDVRVAAGDKKYVEFEWMDVLAGRTLSDQDINDHANVILVTENFVKDYFKVSNQEALWNDVLIGDQYFTIVGVLKEHAWWGFFNIKVAIIPISTAQQKITSDPYYPYLIFETDESIPTVQAIKMIKYTLLKWQGVPHIDEALFQVISTETIVENVQNVSDLLQLALLGIGAIALLVWGIGIMNIMLVSVTERIHEIGMRKAVWAKNHDILIQFLSESVVLGLIGCLIGVLLSRWIIFVLQRFDIPALLNLNAILVAVGFSLWTGIVFGVGPARKAAKMKPIDALRFE